MFAKEELEMHFKTIITVTQILKSRLAGLEVRGEKLKWSFRGCGEVLPEPLGAAGICHILKRHLVSVILVIDLFWEVATGLFLWF